jgi:hypothetical protein
MHEEPKPGNEKPKPGSTEEMRRWIDIWKRFWEKVVPPNPPKK